MGDMWGDICLCIVVILVCCWCSYGLWSFKDEKPKQKKEEEKHYPNLMGALVEYTIHKLEDGNPNKRILLILGEVVYQHDDLLEVRWMNRNGNLRTTYRKIESVKVKFR